MFSHHRRNRERKLESAWHPEETRRGRKVGRRRKFQLTKKKNVTSIDEEESLLFEAQVADVSLIDPDDAVVLLEEALLLGFAAGFQTLHEQALCPAAGEP